MKRQLLTIFGAIAIAACGSKATPPTTAPGLVTADPDGDHDDAVDEAASGNGAADHHDDGGDHPPPTPELPPTPPGPGAAKVKADLLAAETIAYQAAKPVFETYCAGCHRQGGKKASAKKLGHFDITSYPFAGHHRTESGKVIRQVLGIGGGKPEMPDDRPGAVKGDELALIAAWADAFDASQAAGAHD